jgi:hydroxymethylpyrimidine pyrophosphatase-like HAD family hydrolase
MFNPNPNRSEGYFLMSDRATNQLGSAEGNNVGERPRTIAVDFDGVLAEYSGWKGVEVLGAPRMDVIKVLRVLRQEGWKIVVHTTRSEQDIISYLSLHEIPYDEINRNSHYPSVSGKPVATVYWDDRAVRYSGDAFQDLEVIRTFRTWSGRE